MISHWNGSGRILALPTVVLCLAFTRAALAQDATEPDSQPEAASPEATSSDSSTTGSEPDPEEASAAEEAAEAGPAATAASQAETKPSSTARDQAVAAVGVERLQGSAYPAPRVTGIKGGSLSMTSHGHQWPYLPVIGDEPAMRLGLSGSVWSDGSYAYIESGLSPQPPNQKRLAIQSRAVLRATPTYSNESGWFVQGQAEFVAQGDLLLPPNQVMGYNDDLWVRVGKWKVFDITAGRFQGWEIANHYGMGLDINTLERDGAAIETQNFKPKPAYGLTYFWDRADARLGSYAVHLYPTDFLRFELLGQFGAGNNLGGRTIQTNFRPAGILDLGFVKLKAGFEYGKATHPEEGNKENSSRNGFGVALQGVFDPYIEGGVAAARGYEDFFSRDEIIQKDRSNTVTAFSGFVNGRVYGPFIVGVGALYSHWESLSVDERPESPNFGENNFDSHLQAFFALQYSLWDVGYIKFVGSYANWEHQDRSSTPFTNKMLGGRLRFMTVF